MSIHLNEALFEETSHSPSLIDLVGYEQAQQVVDFCFIADPYYPTPSMVEEMVQRLPMLIKAYPSSNPLVGAQHLAAVLHVDPAHLIVGNGATELITELCHLLVPDIGVPIPTFGEYLDKIDRGRLRLYPLQAGHDYQLDLDAYLAWLKREALHATLIINPHNPTGQLFTLAQMQDFLERARWLELVIVDESFIDFAARRSAVAFGDGGPLSKPGACAEHEQALRRAGPASGVLLHGQRRACGLPTRLAANLEHQYAGRVFSACCPRPTPSIMPHAGVSSRMFAGFTGR